MYGLAAIEAANGWSISVIGVTIVFSGLLGLSFIISQFPRIFGALEKKDKTAIPSKLKQANVPPLKVKPDMEEAIRNFDFLTKWLGEPFSLPKLLDIAEKRGMIQPYSMMNEMLVKGIVLPDGKGYFLWKENLKITSK